MQFFTVYVMMVNEMHVTNHPLNMLDATLALDRYCCSRAVMQYCSMRLSYRCFTEKLDQVAQLDALPCEFSLQLATSSIFMVK